MSLATSLVSRPLHSRRLNFYKKYLQFVVQDKLSRRAFFFQSSRHGIADVLDLKPFIDPSDILIDIGANVGQTAFKFRAAFPRNRILCFEPVASTFQRLEERTEKLGVERYRLALGAASGTETIYLTDFSVTSSFHPSDPAKVRGTEQVKVVTLDEFLAEHNGNHVGLLKIDAEGHDLQVIAGAKRILSSGAVKFVSAEVGFGQGPLLPIDNVRDALAEHGFRLFGLYDQALDWEGDPILHIANAVFISKSCCESVYH